MKVQIKTKEDHEAQQYKFKPRAFKIDNIIEVDISTLGSLVANESFSEWQEFLSEEESTDEVITYHRGAFVLMCARTCMLFLI